MRVRITVEYDEDLPDRSEVLKKLQKAFSFTHLDEVLGTEGWRGISRKFEITETIIRAEELSEIVKAKTKV